MMDYLDVKRDDLNYLHLYGDAWPLMERAGKEVADFIHEKYGPGKNICIVCGTGNNAGDGLAAASILGASNSVSVVLIKGKGSIRTPEARKALESYGGSTVGFSGLRKALGKSDIVVDALLGIGISGTPREPYASAIAIMNKSGKPIISIDVPSGMGTESAVRPQCTVTFTDIKRGMDRENSGEIAVRSIGIPDDVRNYAGPGDLVYYTRPNPSSHKGMNGTLAIVGGWEYYGSAVIAGLGASAMATDLVRIYAQDRNYSIIASYTPSLIVRNTTDMGNGWMDEALGSKAILVGPGLGRKNDAFSALRLIMSSARGPVVIDADGLRGVAEDTSMISGKEVVLTPHHGEFRALSGKEASTEAAVEFARSHSVTVVLKGKEDVVTDGSRTIIVRGGNARMTMGGTGDLLAGLISAAASRGIDPFRAAVMGCYINKKAGEHCYARKSYWYSIEDMITAIPEVMKGEVAWAGE